MNPAKSNSTLFFFFNVITHTHWRRGGVGKHGVSDPRTRNESLADVASFLRQQNATGPHASATDSHSTILFLPLLWAFEPASSQNYFPATTVGNRNAGNFYWMLRNLRVIIFFYFLGRHLRVINWDIVFHFSLFLLTIQHIHPNISYINLIW